MIPSSSNYVYLADAAIEIIKDSIVSRLLYKDEVLNVTLFGFDAGQSLTEHTASRPAILQILRGAATLTLDNESKEAGAGAWVYMPSGLRHSIIAKTPAVVLLTLVNDK